MHKVIYRGKIDYIGDTSGKRGQEWFTLTRHSDDSRVLRATSIIDDSQLFRDCVLSFDANWFPLDAFVRIRVENRFQGSGWFRFGERFSECESFTADAGRITQRIETPARCPAFVAHPLAGDVLLAGAFERTPGLKTQTLSCVQMSSIEPNGASGPMIGTRDITLTYLGLEDVTVPAGTFRAKHYRFLLGSLDLPDEDFWCYGPDNLFIKTRWDLVQTTYELVSLETINGDEH